MFRGEKLVEGREGCNFACVFFPLLLSSLSPSFAPCSQLKYEKESRSTACLGCSLLFFCYSLFFSLSSLSLPLARCSLTANVLSCSSRWATRKVLSLSLSLSFSASFARCSGARDKTTTLLLRLLHQQRQRQRRRQQQRLLFRRFFPLNKECASMNFPAIACRSPFSDGKSHAFPVTHTHCEGDSASPFERENDWP